jgi:hypothetical protein
VIALKEVGLIPNTIRPASCKAIAEPPPAEARFGSADSKMLFSGVVEVDLCRTHTVWSLI